MSRPLPIIRGVLSLVWVLGCGAHGSQPALAARPAPPNSSGPTQPAAAPANSTPASPASPASSATPDPLPLDVIRELEVPVWSIALAEGGHVAALGTEPYVRKANGFHALPLPQNLIAKASEHDDAAIYFGRDYEPRVMGTRTSAAGEAPIYWRHTERGWRDGREEIGQLGAANRGGLFGELGNLDPELVCRANAQCIIKRNSGWVTAPAGPTQKRVLLEQGTLWGLDAAGISTIDAHGWAIAIAAPEWHAPGPFWATAGSAWVSSDGALFHYAGGAWQRVPSPIASPAAFWGERVDSLWLVGEGGAAHFDGQVWRRSTLDGPLSAVAGRPDGELWFGGKSGLFRLAARPPQAAR